MNPTILFGRRVGRGFSGLHRVLRSICGRSFSGYNGGGNGNEGDSEYPKRDSEKSDFDSVSHEKSIKDETPFGFSSVGIDVNGENYPSENVASKNGPSCFEENNSHGNGYDVNAEFSKGSSERLDFRGNLHQKSEFSKRISESDGEFPKQGFEKSNFGSVSHEKSIKGETHFEFSSIGIDVNGENNPLEDAALKHGPSGFEESNRKGNEYDVNGEFSKASSERLDFSDNLHEKCEFSKGSSEKSDFDGDLLEKSISDGTFFGLSYMNTDDNDESDQSVEFSPRRRFWEDLQFEADKVFDVLQQDGPGFDARLALDQMQLLVSNRLVREVLIRISKSINHSNRSRCAKLGYKFFVWSGHQTNYRHTSNTYNMIMKIFADCEEFKAMWRLVDEMTESGFPTTARTFNILICTCGEAGMARALVERFIKSKTFNYRPFKHSFNAILHSLLTINQYKLIEWVYQQMLLDGHSPDTLTYNVLMCAKYRLGKLDQFHRLLDEMGRSGFVPDLHTYNILLHVLGKGDKPLAALNLLNYMEEVGCYPSVLHFTALIDGLSRAGNLDACKYFFDEMVKKGCTPDVVSYTVMITGYVAAGELEKAQGMFDDMFVKGQLPNVFTYNSMIRGLCTAGKFDEAWSMLKDMQSKGCSPNFLVYSTLVGKLRNAGKVSEADEVISHMVEKGQYIHLLSKFKGYRRC
ncbi:pentatricopeptide repeat-containing protein At1g55630-like [Magnolia sinica]|uniref:pentatricopeptide repeat-containing protein At1g55630-like n=1 Tax=Magnolia sinica TaxID=86752 RepID=UPI00265B3C54|nr:pentatricopeptide repeat-containing protein At1g55630-like [Magnolia sinica]